MKAAANAAQAEAMGLEDQIAEAQVPEDQVEEKVEDQVEEAAEAQVEEAAAKDSSEEKMS